MLSVPVMFVAVTINQPLYNARRAEQLADEVLQIVGSDVQFPHLSAFPEVFSRHVIDLEHETARIANNETDRILRRKMACRSGLQNLSRIYRTAVGVYPNPGRLLDFHVNT